tara:strand:+ start:921 stop:1109 length:189 start_codon:yes stop_codon:yes gene_type:complete
MKYKIPVTWTVCGVMEIEADNLDEAILLADDAPLPTESDYIDGSFEVNEPMLEYYNENDIPV